MMLGDRSAFFLLVSFSGRLLGLVALCLVNAWGSISAVCHYSLDADRAE
jgi:hypothetical protein